MSAPYSILHGPNLNLLGQREPAIYGALTLNQINQELTAVAAELGLRLEISQHNHEGELVEVIQGLAACPGLVINPGAYTHTSVAIRDALLAVGVPTVEVHLSNVAARESFRRQSYIADIVLGTISGLGAAGYRYALHWLHQRNQ